MVIVQDINSSALVIQTQPPRLQDGSDCQGGRGQRQLPLLFVIRDALGAAVDAACCLNKGCYADVTVAGLPREEAVGIWGVPV